MVVVRLKKAWRGLGDWAESPSSDVLDRTAYARYGSAARANMFCRALSNNSYEGWSRDSRMISLLASHQVDRRDRHTGRPDGDPGSA